MENQSAEQMKEQLRAAQEAKMLAMIRKDKEAGKLPIFNAQGEPLSNPDEIWERKQQLEREKLDALDKEVKALLDTDEGLTETAQGIRLAYQMLFWLLSEAASHDGVRAEHMDYISRMTRQAAMGNPTDAETIRGQIKQFVLPMMLERDKRMRAYAQKRVNHLSGLNKEFLTKGLVVGPLMEEPVKIQAPLIIFFGKPDAVTEATKQIVAFHKKTYNLKPVVLATSADAFSSEDATVLPLMWYREACSRPGGLGGVLSSLLDMKASLLVTENAAKLQDSGTNTLHSVAELARWLKHNFVFGAIGVADEEDVAMSVGTVVPVYKVTLVGEKLEWVKVNEEGKQ